MLTLVLLFILISLLASYIFQLKQIYGYFKRRCVPGPTPTCFLGNLNTLWSSESYSRKLQEWTRRYGRVYGMFEGRTPVWVVSDLNFLQEVFISQFRNFSSRKRTIFSRPSRGKRVHLFDAQGKRWKRQRRVINPTFTSAKLKQLTPTLIQCIDDLCRKLPNNQDFDIYECYKQFSMNVICTCVLGINTESIDTFLEKSTEFFANDIRKRTLGKIGSLLPMLGPLFMRLLAFQNKIREKIHHCCPSLGVFKYEPPASIWLIKHLEKVVKNRRCMERKHIDLLQLMLNAVTAENEIIEGTNSDLDERQRRLTEDEVIMNVFLFLVAGYETVSTSLAYITYALAKYPEEQVKLQEEIDNSTTTDINELEKLDLFIKEVLRMYPIPISFINRVCLEDTIVCGYHISKGDIIQPDIYTIHYSHEIWGPRDPYVFYPDRHRHHGRSQLALMSFGNGPRNCVGIRFAFLEMKLLLVNLLKKYNVLPSNQLEVNLNIKELTLITPEAVWIKLEERTPLPMNH